MVNSPADENFPFISANGVALYFSEDYGGPYRPGGFGDIDMWVSTRASVNDPWETPLNLGPIVNSASLDAIPIASPDGSMLYFCSERPGGLGGLWGDIYQARAIPIVDFNGDGKVDGREILTMAESWGTDDSLCDISPILFSDGIVDVEDVKTLAEYIGKSVDDPTLIAHWALDETQGDIAYDSGGENDGVVSGGTVWQPEAGAVGGTLELDGVDDLVSTPSVLNPADGPFSVLVWIKGGQPGQVTISQVDGVNWLLIDASTETLATELMPLEQRVAVPPLVSETVITDGDWHHVAFVWDGVSRNLYVDDVLAATDEQSSLEGCYGGLYIGCGADQSPDTFFSGLIDDVRIYNRAVRP